MMHLMASFVLCLLLGKRKVKVNPSFRPRWLRLCHPWAEEAMTAAFPARLKQGGVTFKGFEEMLYFWQRDPKLHLCFCRFLTCFLYPHRLSLELLEGRKCAHASGIQKDSKDREGSSENPGGPALQ